MILDSLDIFILCEIWEQEAITTWQMAKKYYQVPECHPTKEGKKEEKKLINGKHELIKQRIKRLAKSGLIKITKEDESKNSKNIYDLELKNIKVGQHKFPDKYAKALCLKLENKWEVFQI